MEDKRAILRIQLDHAAKEGLEQFCHERGMTQIAMMSRLVSWFVVQDDVIQLSVLGLLPKEIAVPAARRLLERMSNNATSSDAAAKTTQGKSARRK